MTIATQLAQRITILRYEDLPAEAVRWAKISLVDTLGCAFAGADEEDVVCGHGCFSVQKMGVSKCLARKPD